MKTQQVRDPHKALITNGSERPCQTLFVSCSFGAIPFAPTRAKSHCQQAFEVARFVRRNVPDAD
jgi:hypothetical protein